MIDPFNREGRTALVTGSSRGFGLAIARALWNGIMGVHLTVDGGMSASLGI